MIPFVVTLVGLIVVLLVALYRKDAELVEAIERGDALAVSLQAIRGERNGLKTERDFLRKENAEFRAVAPKPAPKKITARRKPKKAVE